MHIIGIHGPLGGGKTFLANEIKDCFAGVEILPFAKPLKDFAFELGWDGKKNDKGRRLLQLLGTDCGRQCIDESIWVQHWEKARQQLECEVVIADDMRFPNELEHIRDLGGTLVKLFGRDTYNSTEQRNHPSEQPLEGSDFHFVIHNQPGARLDSYVLAIVEFIENG